MISTVGEILRVLRGRRRGRRILEGCVSVYVYGIGVGWI